MISFSGTAAHCRENLDENKLEMCGEAKRQPTRPFASSFRCTNLAVLQSTLGLLNQSKPHFYTSPVTTRPLLRSSYPLWYHWWAYASAKIEGGVRQFLPICVKITHGMTVA